VFFKSALFVISFVYIIVRLVPVALALPPAMDDVAAGVGATATAWWGRALLPVLESGRAVASALPPAAGANER
jgi:ABC-type sulfate transport system permease component